MMPTCKPWVLAVLVAFLAPVAADKANAAAQANAADKPAKKSYTWHEYRADVAACLKQELVGGYNARGKKDPAWDAPAVRFLDGVATMMAATAVDEFYRPTDTPTVADLAAQALALMKLKCDDPLVRFGIAAVYRRMNHPNYHGYFESACDGEKLPPYLRYLASVEYAELPSASRKDRSIDTERFRRAAETCRGKLDGARRRLVHHLLLRRDAALESRQALVAELNKHNDVDPWLKDMVTGHLHVKLAWKARGGGWANTVTPEGWKLFHENLVLARDAYVRAWKLAPELPEAPASMITIAMGAGDRLNEPLLDWFGRALEAQVDFTEAYEGTRFALRPRWGGTYEQIYELGLACIAQPRYDSLVPWQYVESIKSICDDVGRPWFMLEDKEILTRFTKVTDGYALARGPGGGDYFKSVQAAAQVHLNDLTEARKVLDEWSAKGGRADPKAFAYMGLGNGRDAISRLYARTGPNVAMYDGADFMAKERDFQGAAETLADVRKTLEAGDPEIPWLETQILELSSRARFDAGEWAPMVRAKSLAGWRNGGGTWSVDARGVLVGHSGPNGGAWLMMMDDWLPIDPARGFEVSAKITVTPSGAVGLSGGIAFSSATERGAHGSIQLAPGAGQVWFLIDKKSRHVAAPAAKNGAELLVRCQQNMVTVFLDGKQVGEPFPLPNEFRDGLRVGVGSGETGTDRYEDLRVRKLIAKEE